MIRLERDLDFRLSIYNFGQNEKQKSIKKSLVKLNNLEDVGFL